MGHKDSVLRCKSKINQNGTVGEGWWLDLTPIVTMNRRVGLSLS